MPLNQQSSRLVFCFHDGAPGHDIPEKKIKRRCHSCHPRMKANLAAAHGGRIDFGNQTLTYWAGAAFSIILMGEQSVCERK
jgi:hypothetical protein